MYFHRMVAIVAILQLTCYFCSGDPGKPKPPSYHETMTGERVYEDLEVKEVEAILQDLDRLKNNFLHEMIAINAKRFVQGAIMNQFKLNSHYTDLHYNN